jgi:GH25 family lysozyme M1 (1,4-beta-N-acetylmuramidase)
MQDIVLDLSHWEVVSSWDDIKQSGVVGIVYKATEGDSYVDPTYAEARDGAEEAKLLWGAYHFLRPGDLKAQAHFFVNTVGADLDLYCADHEDAGVSVDELKDFLTEVYKVTGKRAVIYSGHVIKDQLGDEADPDLGRYRLWIAHYTDDAQPDWPKETWPHWWLWQYTETGSCPGVDDEVDRNYYDGSADQLQREWAHPRVD